MEEKKENKLFDKIKETALGLIRNPKKMMPSIVLAAIWLVFSIMSVAGANLPILRFLYTLTYSNGGMFGGLFGAIGGIFGKAVFAACVTGIVNAVIAKKNPLKNISKEMKGIFVGGLDSAMPVVMGGGMGILLYWFFNVTSSPVNCAVAVAGAVTALTALMSKKGLFFTGVFKLLEKLSKGKAPSKMMVTRVLTGFAAGFALSLPLTFIRSRLLLFLLGLILTAGSIVFYNIKHNNPNKAMAAALLMFMIMSSLLPVSAKAEFFDDVENAVPYRGRLTYTHDSENKYGQPFPDLMDFDGDGYITWNDLELQKKLSHDPDLLDRYDHAAASYIMALLTGLAGAGAGAVGGAMGAGASALAELGGDLAWTVGDSGSDNDGDGNGNGDDIPEGEKVDWDVTGGMNDVTKDNPFIKRDAAGDLVVKDPVTGNELHYSSNGDGTYTNLDTGGTSTENDMADYVNHRIEHYDLYMQDEIAKNKAIAEQRAKNGELSQLAKDAAAEKAAMREQWAMEDKQRAYVDKLKEQYGYYNEQNLMNKLAEDQMKNEIESYEHIELEDEYKKSQEYCETVEKVADKSIDVLAEVTGDEGKAIKNAYTFTKSTLAKGSEAFAEGRSVTGGLVQGAFEGGINVMQNKANSPTEKFIANVGGDMAKAGVDAKIKGENVGEKMAGAGGMAALNTGIDVGFDMVGDAVKSVAGGTDVVKNVMDTDLTKNTMIDATKTLIAGQTKDTVDKAFKSGDDD